MGFLPQSGIPTVFREGRIRSRLIGKEDDSSPVIREEEECLSEESKLLFLQNIKAFRDAMGVQMILRHIDHLPETLLVDIFNPLIQKVSDVRQPTKKPTTVWKPCLQDFSKHERIIPPLDDVLFFKRWRKLMDGREGKPA